jgi:hypothetical protein
MKIILAFKHSQNENTKWYWLLASTAIRKWTKSKYFHVEIAFRNKWIAAGTDKGIKIENLLPLKDPNFDYFELDVPELSEEKEQILMEFLQEQENTGYDWKGIYLSQILFLNWEHPSKWFCSEIVAKVLELLYEKELIGIAPNKLSPGDIYRLLENKLTKI